ncbi:hypothetical protein EJB05_20854 [Eragrostis curvula]|uniref:Histone-lysine N-methyltransferase n=1 Tax=Eragrostis curvula TaxID=38414 RepID=A0A5J9V1A3_9POAL|nr:hypothetical protein EJB05_20854 [Eragrostis curvula]
MANHSHVDGDSFGNHGGDAPTLEEHIDEWAVCKMLAGVPAHRCVLPFLTGAPKAVECRLCSKIIYPGEEIKCLVRLCGGMFHMNCVAKDTANFIADRFKCPQHNAGLTDSIEEAFHQLPLPYVNEDFKIDSAIRQGLNHDLLHEVQIVYEYGDKRHGTRSQIGGSKKRKVTTRIPYIKETGSVYPDSRDKQPSVRRRESKQGEKYSISRCFDVLDAMDDVSDEGSCTQTMPVPPKTPTGRQESKSRTSACLLGHGTWRWRHGASQKLLEPDAIWCGTAPKSGDTLESSSSPSSHVRSISTSPPNCNAFQTLARNPSHRAAMPDLSTVYLPPFPELSADAGGGLVGERAGDVAADEAAASASASGSGGGGGDPVILEECQLNSRVRNSDLAAASEGEGAMAARRAGGKKPSSAPSPTPKQRTVPPPARTFEDCVSDWAARKVAAGAPAHHCELPFLTGAPKAVECRLCSKIIYAGEEIRCSVSRCRERFHLNCVVKDTVNVTADSFKCPQHFFVGFLFHMPAKTSILIQPSGILLRLFTSHLHIRQSGAMYISSRRNVLMFVWILDAQTADLILVVKMITNRCGWGAVALEPLEKGDFVIEYVGEVIDDATCEQRLWDMKLRGDKNFYMCEISKDFTIDATFKGNISRFLNHSCEPNCKLEKWQVDGETRVGVFASRSINVGEPLTYDYRFVHFGRKVKCRCGALNCQGYLGSQLKNPTQNALAVAAPNGQLHDSLPTQQEGSASEFKPMTHLLPWTNCIDVSFNLRSKRKLSRLCWGRKRKRTSLVAYSTSTSLQTSVSRKTSSWAAHVPRVSVPKEKGTRSRISSVIVDEKSDLV